MPDQPATRAPESPASFVRTEAAALNALANRLEHELQPQVDRALWMMESCTAQGRRVVVTGIGKSGIIARKIAATLRSTGTPAHFLHPAEALHGDLGMVGAGDVALALSYSGETEELLRLLPALDRLAVPVVALCGCVTSTLARCAAVSLDVSVSAEACSLNLAPTASTTVMLALGDALALELSRRRGFEPAHFAELHPGGRLGFRLSRVRDLMHVGDALPCVTASTPMTEVIYEMSRKKLGMTTVLTPAHGLAGIISDGDLRRMLERAGQNALGQTAGDIMNATPLTISGAAFATDALTLMEERKITSLVVVEENVVQGVVHLHDLWQTKP
jgi:arabinose-5-phosphate isomerase